MRFLALLLAAAPSGTATVPLQELIPLVSSAPSAQLPPPVDAMVVKSTLKARLAPDALLVDAHYEVEVLGQKWARLSLLEIGPDTCVTDVPAIEDATVAVHQDALRFISKKPGRYAFDVSLTVRAPAQKAHLVLGADGLPVPLHLEADPAVFKLSEPGPDFYPRERRWPRAGGGHRHALVARQVAPFPPVPRRSVFAELGAGLLGRHQQELLPLSQPGDS